MIIIIIIIIIIISFQRQRPQDWTGSGNLALVRRSGVMTAELFFDIHRRHLHQRAPLHINNYKCKLIFCRDPQTHIYKTTSKLHAQERHGHSVLTFDDRGLVLVHCAKCHEGCTSARQCVVPFIGTDRTWEASCRNMKSTVPWHIASIIYGTTSYMYPQNNHVQVDTTYRTYIAWDGWFVGWSSASKPRGVARSKWDNAQWTFDTWGNDFIGKYSMFEVRPMYKIRRMSATVLKSWIYRM